MERDLLRQSNSNDTRSRDRTGGEPVRRVTTSSDFVLQWGNRKRLRCMKIQVRDKDDSNNPVTRTTVRVDRRVVRPDSQPSTASQTNGHLNLRQRPLSPARPPPQRILRNSETASGTAMRGQSNGGGRRIPSPENNRAASSEHDSKKGGGNGGGGSSSGSGEAAAPAMVWPPKFVIALTNKEKEEDFMAIKGSKLPQRPKKRAKFIQRTVNLVSPGAWLCDLTLERYEVREKKITKKRPRGLKAMGNNVESESE